MKAFNSMKNIIQNDQGISLVEVMVASGLMIAISVGVMTFMQSGYKTSKELEVRQASRDIRDQLYLAVQKNYCGLAQDPAELKDKGIVIPINDKNAGPKEIAELYMGPVVLSKGKEYGDFFIAKDKPITITAPRKDQPFVETLSTGSDTLTEGGYYKIGQYVLAEMHIRINSKSAIANKKIIPFHFMIFLRLDDDNKIIDCKSFTDLAHAKEACQSMEDAGDNENAFIGYEWLQDELKCKVTITIKNKEEVVEEAEQIDSLAANSQGKVNPNFVLTSDFPEVYVFPKK